MIRAGLFRYIKVVAAVHVTIVLALVAASACRRLSRKSREFTMPVEFVIDADVPVQDGAPLEFEPEPEPVPERRPAIERSERRVVREQTVDPPRRRKLTDDEIRRLLAEGVVSGDRTSISDEDAKCFELVRRTLHQAWVQPSKTEVGEAVAEISIQLAADGRLVSRSFSSRSGNELLDSSVMQAVVCVKRIAGLSPGFVGRHRTIEVSFRVE